MWEDDAPIPAQHSLLRNFLATTRGNRVRGQLTHSVELLPSLSDVEYQSASGGKKREIVKGHCRIPETQSPL